jgi:AraC-like DNA-binding protein
VFRLINYTSHKQVIRQTVSIAFVQGSLAGAVNKELDAHALLAQADISPDLLGSTQSRISLAKYSAFWRTLAARLGDEFLGDSPLQMEAGTLSMLCHSVIHDEKLGSALRHTLQFFSFLFTDIGVSLVRDDNYTRIKIVNQAQPLRIFSHASFLQMLHGLASWLVGRRIPILKAGFCQTEPFYGAELRSVFCTNPHFDQASTFIVFGSHHPDAPIRQNRQLLKEFLRNAPASFLMESAHGNTSPEIIRRYLQHAAKEAKWPAVDTKARHLNMTSSTMRRHLDAQGEPYQLIKNDPRNSVTDIASELGFTEPSAFYRAFKKWSGQSIATLRGRLRSC